MNRGFTVVEVLVTLVVISILLGLGTVGIRSSLVNARESERKADIETIARGLEARYNRSYSYKWVDGDGITQTSTFGPGDYPGSTESWDVLFYWGRAPIAEALPGVSAAAWMSPGGHNTSGGSCILYGFPSAQPKCDAAEKPSNIQEAFADGSGGWKDVYLYEFVGKDGKYCNGDCTRYNLYWISETETTTIPGMGIPGLQVWRSKHQ